MLYFHESSMIRKKKTHLTSLTHCILSRLSLLCLIRRPWLFLLGRPLLCLLGQPLVSSLTAYHLLRELLVLLLLFFFFFFFFWGQAITFSLLFPNLGMVPARLNDFFFFIMSLCFFCLLESAR